MKRHLFSLLLSSQALVGMAQTDALWRGFCHPQDSCRTKMWWFHGETQTTREGITADLEAFKAAGLGGVVYYDQVHGKGEQALKAFSPEWWQMFVFAAQEAKLIGLTFETHFSNGYCAGGPWITEELGMQMLVCSDTVVQGGTLFDGRLSAAMPKKRRHAPVAVVAFPAPKTGWMHYPMKANRTIHAADGPVFIVTDMGHSVTVRSMTYQVSARSRTKTRSMNVPGPMQEEFYGVNWKRLPMLGELEVSNDGEHWRQVAAIKPFYSGNTGWRDKTISFPATEGRYFRLNLHDWQLPGENDLKLGDFVLSTMARTDDWEVKAGLVSDFIDGDDTPCYAEAETIAPEEMIDLTDCLEAGGDLLSPSSHFTWRAPKGQDWVILRFDQVPTGGMVKHGRQNLMGLECDKLSARAATVQWEHYFKVMLDTLNRYGLKPDGMLIDSHEAGAQNWTEGFQTEFRNLRGYDLMAVLPVMAGYVVGSSEQTAQVLADVRRTVADLISYRHFGTIDSLCRSVGVPFTAQAIGNGLCIVGDPIQAKGQVEIPQGEFWHHHPHGGYDIKESSSAAHLYAKRLASGEAFTDARFDTPLSYIKTLADNAWCYGLQEFVVCASAYQPGGGIINTAGGRHYCMNRMNTYWPYSRPFWDFQARSAFLLRQGQPVVDFCVYIGEDAPVKIRSERLPVLPAGTDFDAFTSDALFKRMAVKDGRITLPDGMNYEAMVIPPTTRLTAKASQRIGELKRQGATILYTPYPTVSMPDAALTHGDMKLLQLWFCHRQTKTADIYFFSNHGTTAISDTMMLRSKHRQAEWWNPVDGSRHKLPAQQTADGRTQVPLTMVAKESGFVVLSDIPSQADMLPGLPQSEMVIEGPWLVDFDPQRGGPGRIEMDSLYDWTRSADQRVSHYSGTAVYTKMLKMKRPKSGQQVWLAVDGLHNLALVTLNGHEVGTLWCEPFRIDLTPYVRQGKNELKLEVVNAWTNRMILDASLPDSQRITHAFPEVVKPNDRLVPSGIDGKVSLIYSEKRVVSK